MADQVFMCYAREDEGFVLELAGALKTQGVPVWLDQWELSGGVDWALKVEEALYRSSHLVVVISPASRASDEVRSETKDLGRDSLTASTHSPGSRRHRRQYRRRLGVWHSS